MKTRNILFAFAFAFIALTTLSGGLFLIASERSIPLGVLFAIVGVIYTFITHSHIKQTPRIEMHNGMDENTYLKP